MKVLRWAVLQGVAFGMATWAVVAGGAATAGVIVVPNDLATVEGNAADNFTFSIFTPSGPTPFPPSVRFQQVYDASQFSALSGPMLITQIAFRPNGSATSLCSQPVTCPEGKAFTSTLPSIQIDLATTNRIPMDISLVAPPPPFMSVRFADNLFFADQSETDDTMVFSGALSLASAFTGPVGGPKDFDIIINLQHLFLYDPAKGNLLLDVRNFSNVETTFFDSVSVVNDSVLHVDAADVGAVAGPRNTAGLVTEFIVTPVAEPDALVILASGLISLLCCSFSIRTLAGRRVPS
jgi:hypothetical protein